MSDYFGALMRSTGAVQAPAAAGVPPTAAQQPAGADIVEQDVEVQAGVPSKRVVRHPALSNERSIEAGASVAGERVGDPSPQATADARFGADDVRPPADAGDRNAAQATPKSFPQLEEQALAHPALRAAVRWVAADPQSAHARAGDTPQARIEARAPQQEAAQERSEPEPAATRNRLGPAPQPAAERRSEAAAKPAAAHEFDLSLPPALRARPAAVALEAGAPMPMPLPPRHSVDVHIGTIHVAVDAPAERIVAQAAPPAVRLQPQPQAQARAIERGGFSRLRLPRL